MTSRFFPSRIRTVDDAIDYLPLWVETIGGEQRDGLNVRELSDIRDQIIEIHVRRFHVDFPALGTVPTAGRRVAASPVTLEYIATKVVTTHVRLS